MNALVKRWNWKMLEIHLHKMVCSFLVDVNGCCFHCYALFSCLCHGDVHFKRHHIYIYIYVFLRVDESNNHSYDDGSVIEYMTSWPYVSLPHIDCVYVWNPIDSNSIENTKEIHDFNLLNWKTTSKFSWSSSTGEFRI